MATKYIRVDNPWFLEWDTGGRPALGYKVYTVVAGTVDTLVTTYQDRGLTSPNTNPIILNSRGQAHIFTNVAIKLVYTAPLDDMTSPIWTEDYVTEQQEVVADKGAASGTSDNVYQVDTSPMYTSIPDGFSLVMLPDISNLGTMILKSFIGTGINDASFTGPYVGGTPSTFTVEIDGNGVVDRSLEGSSDMSLYSGATTAIGQSFTGEAYDLDSCIFKLKKYGSPTGNAVAKLYAHSGTYGTSSLPTGGALATSDNFDVSTLTTGYQEIEFTFSSPYTMSAGVKYVIVIEYSGGDSSNYVVVQISDTDVHDGNGSYYTGSWTAFADGDDVYFSVNSNMKPDSFSWRKDAGSWTEDILITGSSQSLMEGIYVRFAAILGHTVGDYWTQTVRPPAFLDFCDLGNKIIYKSSGGVLTALDANDIIADIPAHLDFSQSQDCWILLNPSLPAFSTQVPSRARKEVTATYTVDPDADWGLELSCKGTFTVTLPTCAAGAGRFYYIVNAGSGVITISRAGAPDVIIAPGYDTGVNSISLSLTSWTSVQLVTDGVDWHILSVAGPFRGWARYVTPGASSWTCPENVTTIYVTACPGGGGGAGAYAVTLNDTNAGGGGEPGIHLLKAPYTVVPGTAYPTAVGAAGAAGTSTPGAGGAGGITSLGPAIFVLSGGTGGALNAGIYATNLYCIGKDGRSGGMGVPGRGGHVAGGPGSVAGGAAVAYGAGGGGGAVWGSGSGVGVTGGIGSQGILIIEW